jgi:hypothetical protein
MDPSQTISAHQPSTQGPDPGSGNQERPPQETPATLGYLKAAKIVLTRDRKMLLDPHNFLSIMAAVFMWIVLAGLLVLPGSLPTRSIRYGNQTDDGNQTDTNVRLVLTGNTPL